MIVQIYVKTLPVNFNGARMLWAKCLKRNDRRWHRQEKQKKWILRIALYLIGIMVLALGITLNTKTNLGVSPIISMPYAVAQIFGYETGTAVFVAYLIFIVLQIVLLKG